MHTYTITHQNEVFQVLEIGWWLAQTRVPGQRISASDAFTFMSSGSSSRSLSAWKPVKWRTGHQSFLPDIFVETTSFQSCLMTHRKWHEWVKKKKKHTTSNYVSAGTYCDCTLSMMSLKHFHASRFLLQQAKSSISRRTSKAFWWSRCFSGEKEFTAYML